MVSMKTVLPAIILVFCLGYQPVHAAEQEFSVLSNWVCWRDASSFLLHHLNDEASAYLTKRKHLIESLKTPDQWKARQDQVKKLFLDILGPFPDRTPLNPQITGIIQKNGYRVEKVLFESMPEFYVTGCLFIPDSLNGKAPAILNPIGHTNIAFRGEHYQQLILNLVQKGFIVFAFDPLGQGERLQYYDPAEKKSRIGGPTAEHSYFGRQCFLNGVSSARYFVWDGIRAIDYLLTREEVDPERIAVTGLSGGGTQTSYIMAMDERVSVAAPACYITSFERLLRSIGPQDAEQNYYRQISHGLDHADFIEVRAPKPTLIVATTRDFFSIQGVRETFAEAKAAFDILGSKENLEMAVDDHTHGYTKKTREALYTFMQKHLSNPGDPTDREVEFLTPEELTVTDTGQVLTALDGKRVFDYNKKTAERNLSELEERRKRFVDDPELITKSALEISGYSSPLIESSPVFMGAYQRESCRVEQYVLSSEGDCIIPLVLFVPEGDGPFPALICIHPEGKQSIVKNDDLISNLLKKDFLVVAADLSGIGEVGESLSGIKAPFTCLLIGRSLPGFHAGEIVRIADYIETRNDVSKGNIGLLAYSHTTPAALHAAAFDESLSAMALIEPLIAYESVATSLYYDTPGWIDVPGILTKYDLPDLAACVAPRPLLILSPVDARLQPVDSQECKNGYEVTTTIYESQRARNKLDIRGKSEIDEHYGKLIVEWMVQELANK